MIELVVINGVEYIKDKNGWLMTKAVFDKINAEFEKVFSVDPKKINGEEIEPEEELDFDDEDEDYEEGDEYEDSEYEE